MGNGRKNQEGRTRTKLATGATACRHYWLIEMPEGDTSKGRCKLCGSEREFSNSFVGHSATAPQRLQEDGERAVAPHGVPL